MKVIDLLNKIANGEHNFSFKYGEDEFFYDFDSKRFVDTRFKETLGERYSLDMMLNDEVEVIEEKEETKPITKESIEALGYACGEIQKCFTNGWNKSLKNEPLIEEDKKIPTLQNLNLTRIDINKEGQIYGVTKKEMVADIQTLQNWINKIIDYINKEDK